MDATRNQLAHRANGHSVVHAKVELPALPPQTASSMQELRQIFSDADSEICEQLQCMGEMLNGSEGELKVSFGTSCAFEPNGRVVVQASREFHMTKGAPNRW